MNLYVGTSESPVPYHTYYLLLSFSAEMEQLASSYISQTLRIHDTVISALIQTEKWDVESKRASAVAF